jgi:hydroxybutyrate-dimer hydrolase
MSKFVYHNTLSTTRLTQISESFFKPLTLAFALGTLLSCYSEQNQNSTYTAKHTVQFELAAPWKKYQRTTDDDLLTAGLGLEGLQTSNPPAVNKVRQRAYYSNIRALLDVTTNGGFGRLFGPKPGQTITGVEYIASIKPQSDRAAADYSIQIPDNFNTKVPCVIVAPSSGSRDIYGAVGITGFWALPKGCAVAYTNKGTGTGFYFVDLKQSFDAEGQLSSAPLLKSWVNEQRMPAGESKTWVATRHAHSGHNLQKDWGQYTLIAAQLALDALSEHFERPFNSDNTLIIAAGISNGGAAVIQAAENDEQNLLDGVVAGEPNISVKLSEFTLLHGNQPQTIKLRHTFYSFLLQGLLTPCANLVLMNTEGSNPILKMQAEQACQQLQKSKYIDAKSLDILAQKATQKLIDSGINPASLPLGPIYTTMGLWPALNATYASSYARLKLFEDPCGGAFEYPRHSPISTSSLAQIESIWPMSNGIPPTAGVILSRYKELRQSETPLNDYNQAFASQLCYLAWLDPELHQTLALSQFISKPMISALQQGLSETLVNGNLQRKPTIIIHGQADRLIPVNLSSRPYYWLNQTRFGTSSPLTYLEIQQAQHFDALLAYPPFDRSLSPLHPFFEQALDAMWAHLTSNKPLPKSGVVRPLLRQISNNQLEPLSEKHLTSIFNSEKHIIASETGLKL